jgi:hypothetical protein
MKMRETPKKPCPKCSRYVHVALRNCVCGFEFLKVTKINQFGATAVLTNEKSIIEKMLPPGFDYIGSNEHNGKNFYTIIHKEFNGGTPFIIDDLTKLASACWSYVLTGKGKPRKKKVAEITKITIPNGVIS